MKRICRLAWRAALASMIVTPVSVAAKTMTGYCKDGNSYIVMSNLVTFEAGSHYPDKFISNRYYRGEEPNIFDRALSEEWEATLRKYYNRSGDFHDRGFCYMFADPKDGEAAFQAYAKTSKWMKIVPFTPSSPRSATAEKVQDRPKPSEPSKAQISAPSLVIKDTSAPQAKPWDDAMLQARREEAARQVKLAAASAREKAKSESARQKMLAEMRKRGRAQ